MQSEVCVHKSLWKADWLIGAAVTVVFLLSLNLAPVQRLERVFFDLAVQLSSHHPGYNEVTVVAIDQASLEDDREAPARDQLARVIDAVHDAGARTIGVALDLSQAENQRALGFLDSVNKTVTAAGAADMSAGFARRLQSALQDARRGLETDDYLSYMLRNTRGVVLAMPYRDGAARHAPPATAGDELRRFSLNDPEFAVAMRNSLWQYLALQPPLTRSQYVYPPLAKFTAKAQAVGHWRAAADVDGRSRFVPMVLEYDQRYYPAFELAVLAAYLRQSPQAIRLDTDRRLGVADSRLSLDPGLRYLPYFYDTDKDKKAYSVLSFRDVARANLDPSLLRDKAVLIGVTAPQLAPPLLQADGEEVAPVIYSAGVLASMINGEGYVVPAWNAWLLLLAAVLVGLYLALLLPRIKPATGMAISAITVVLLANIYTIVMVTQGLVLAIIAPVIQLLVGHGIIAVRQWYQAGTSRWRAESAESNRMLGIAFQGQGQLDLAFEKFQRCPPERGILELMYSLGLDFERRRQFAKAGVVFQYIVDVDKGFRDVKKRILNNREMENAYLKGGSGPAANGTMVLSNSMVQKPMLGRYQVLRELGRGAMGMVYYGEDPKINRVVAIKTMALSHEFDAEELEEVKSRFFREARTAGRLNHPNIVTIYDVGEEQDLAYIAMDYLEGDNLLPYTKADNLLSIQDVFYVVSAVAKALDYAHSENVVHRDIKPANIMYDRETRKVKITDFGVACLIDASKTKTGTILGTPSYMSPEQLSGARVDGRSDIFSLGIMFFQLLTGELPFVADSMAALMYKITNEREPDIKMLRPELPTCINQILRKALAKQVEQRFQNGVELYTALQKCLAIVEKRVQKAS